MQRWHIPALAAVAGAVATLLVPAVPRAATCDEYASTIPAAGAQIVLDASDYADSVDGQLRSFIATGSVGKVAVTVASASPPGIVRSVSATPEVSRLSRDSDEQLKGIAVSVALRARPQQVQVVLGLRQACARYYRNSFLYY